MYKLLPILLFAYGLAVTTDEIYDNSWAVIIGINEYEHVDKLNYAVQDAEAVKNLLISNFNFPKEHIIILTDKEATLENIKTKLFEVATSVTKGDRLLVYFAGHGQTYEKKDGGELGYLIPVDGKTDNIFATCLPMDDIKRVSSITSAKHVLFLMDACYGGLLAVDARGLSKTTPGYIDKITRDNARQIITAGGKGEQVIEKSEWGHSAFAKNLLHGLETGIADEDSDGYITADELGSFLKKRVTIDSDNRQTPVKRRFGSDEGEFVFINDVNIEKQIINITPGAENDDIRDIDELRDKIASLEEQLSKPVKFIQGCTDDRAENYNPDANLDDDSCIILKGGEAYIRFGDFNSSDSTLDVYITAYRPIFDIEFQTQGFKIVEMIDGILSDNEFLLTEDLIQKSSDDSEQEMWYFALSIMGAYHHFPSDPSQLLFKARILPNAKTFCLNNINSDNYSNIFIGECITVNFERNKISACDMPINSVYITSSGSVLFNSNSDIAGFQFDLVGASVNSAAGGCAEDSDFTISTSPTSVLAFSLSGATFSGCGIMIELELDLDGRTASISGIVVSDPSGNDLNFSFNDK